MCGTSTVFYTKIKLIRKCWLQWGIPFVKKKSFLLVWHSGFFVVVVDLECWLAADVSSEVVFAYLIPYPQRKCHNFLRSSITEVTLLLALKLLEKSQANFPTNCGTINDAVCPLAVEGTPHLCQSAQMTSPKKACKSSSSTIMLAWPDQERHFDLWEHLTELCSFQRFFFYGYYWDFLLCFPYRIFFIHFA